MKLIVGLGNPGRRYERTRHNVGFDVLDRLAARRDLTFSRHRAQTLVAIDRRLGKTMLLAKPQTFMNLSGEAVAELVESYGISLSDLLVIVDDVNLPLGQIRVRRRGSAGGHHGLRSIAVGLASLEFARLRLGVGRGDVTRDLADHVLARFEPAELDVIAPATERAADAAEMFVTSDIERVMSTFNAPGEQAAGRMTNDE